MKIKIITIGEPKLSFAREGFLEYIKRLRGHHTVDVIHMSNNAEDKKIIDVCGDGFLVVMDENGKEFTSRELAEFLEKRSIESVGEIVFLVGGPDGHSDKIKSHAHTLMSMSKLTFPHDLAMLFLSEALYRASMISHNHPYHRD
jgi:23S rRNA (pseudouridine1915-N3)-methyltransferase